MSIGISEMQAGSIVFARQLACCNPGEVQAVRTEFLAQLGRIHKKVRPRKNGTNGYYYTGKSGAQADDIGFSLLFCLYWIQQYQSREDYERQSAHLTQNGRIQAASVLPPNETFGGRGFATL